MSPKVKTKERLVYIGIRLPLGLVEQLEKAVKEVKSREPWRRYKMSDEIRERLSKPAR